MAEAAKATSESPYIHGTKIRYAWDATSISALKRCPRYFQLTIEDGWQGRKSNVHLRFGLEYHQALQEYEIFRVKGQDHKQAVFSAVKALAIRLKDYPKIEGNGKRSENVKTKAGLIRTVIWYLEKFKDDTAKTVILDNGKPAVELSFRFELSFGPIMDTPSTQPYLLCGHLDRVVTFSGDVYLMDHKTSTTTLGSYYFDQFEPDNQMSLYSVAANVIFGSPLKGVIVDAAQVAQDWSRFVRGFTYRTPGQLQEWLKDLSFWLTQATTYSMLNYWPMNDLACDKYGGCPFRGICSKDPKVRPAFLEADFVQLPEAERWNPLTPR
jgi:PD-(D/E)XK nuclease superfamily